ncbi:hypothetical protein TSUD_127830 [Trifolium subterraneum]|nr:hypothetical protein TSUD_127830 [Trifolium subterraneum]
MFISLNRGTEVKSTRKGRKNRKLKREGKLGNTLSVMLEDDEQLRLRIPARFGFAAAELFVMIEKGQSRTV